MAVFAALKSPEHRRPADVEPLCDLILVQALGEQFADLVGLCSSTSWPAQCFALCSGVCESGDNTFTQHLAFKLRPDLF